jgi:hypothetical protein
VKELLAKTSSEPIKVDEVADAVGIGTPRPYKQLESNEPLRQRK